MAKDVDVVENAVVVSALGDEPIRVLDVSSGSMVM